MAESITYKRVVFPKGQQKCFLDRVLRKFSLDEVSRICSCSQKTIRDWRRERFLMDFAALNKLCKALKTPLPSNIKLRDRYWYVIKGCSAGGRAVWKKYGRIGNDPGYRKQQWRKWWESTGKYRTSIINTPLPIKTPQKSQNLAEFTGIVLGDGGLSNYQLTITLCSKDEEAYSEFVVRLIKKLFDVSVTILGRKKQSTIDLIISRINLIRFCVKGLGLKRGNKIKQQVDVPNWIKKNKSYAVACVRGLIDTDGSVFDHKYKVNGKLYSYKKIGFTSRSNPLRMSVFNTLRKMGINARLSGSYDVRIDSQDDVRKYFKIFNSNNPKHLIRYKK
ncbi:MAG: LAGLIDADG family homing endonuclease [Candidatus Nealsonbacteria bacterium]